MSGICERREILTPRRLEVGDTAGLEACATFFMRGGYKRRGSILGSLTGPVRSQSQGSRILGR